MSNLYDTIGIIKNGNKTKLPVIIVENIDADGIAYDNTSSGLSASDVQGAIDEVNGNVEQKARVIKQAIQSDTNTISFVIERNSDYIINGIIFSRTWSNPGSSSPLTGSLYWFSICPTGTSYPIGFYAIRDDSSNTGSRITNMTFDDATNTITVTFATSTSHFFEVIYG